MSSLISCVLFCYNSAMEEDPEANAYYNARKMVDASLRHQKKRPTHATSSATPTKAAVTRNSNGSTIRK
jgi:hypothetical protein